MENDTKLDFSKSENLKLAEQKITEKIRMEMEQTIAHLQKDLKSDALGFGTKIHEQQPAEWKKIKSQWKEMFPDVPVTVKVDIKFERIGRTLAPAQLKPSQNR